MNREVKQKTNEEKRTFFRVKKTRVFGSFQHKQKQTKNKPKTNHKNN